MSRRTTAVTGGSDPSIDMLLDVSRLVWRVWRGGLPTGVDRVCLAYVEHFGGRSLAVVQRSGMVLTFSARQSDRLFSLLANGGHGARAALLRFFLTALPGARRKPPMTDMIYLNVGHTGLNEAALPAWIRSNRVRAVYLVHDLIPISHPEYCRPGEAEKHRRRMANALASAAGLIGNSQATLEELARFAESQGSSLPATLAAWISGKPKPSAVVPKKLKAPFFVSVGTIEARKNHLMLLRLWRDLVAEQGEDAPTLVIIGQRGWEADEALAILDNPGTLKGHVLELGGCGDDELASWLAGAEALLMPSFVEGFGLPVIEALQLGTPVIASDLPVFREIAGDIPAYVDAADLTAWRAAIDGFSASPQEVERQRALMKSWHAPDWPSHFRGVEDWLADLPPAR